MCHPCRALESLLVHSEWRAEAIVQMLSLDGTEGKAYAITSTQGEGPGKDPSKWQALLA